MKLLCNTNLLIEYINDVFPAAEAELWKWKQMAEKSDRYDFAAQALASINSKRFHAQGGSVYALYPGCDRQNLIPLIVALQTISDYLDNLCDRMGCTDEKVFKQLHISLEEALTPWESKKTDYFKFYGYDDGGYLNSLVDECKCRLKALAAYDRVHKHTVKLVRMYGQMQSYKHVGLNEREKKITYWANQNRCERYGINQWEFSAAAGSTLGIFMLCAMASSSLVSEREIDMVIDAYFPWVCGIHILLDYFIDQEEDRYGGDLNFISYYENTAECCERMSFFLRKSIEKVRLLPYPDFHLLVIKGLLSMYLSDPKVSNPDMIKVRELLINVPGSFETKMMYHACKFLRYRGII